MPSLPPPVWAELHYDGAWTDITEDVRVTTAPVAVTRGLSSESSTEADPTACTCDLDSRDDRYAPRNPMSPLYGLIGRNTPFRWGYDVGSPWARIQQNGAIDYASLFVNPAPALDITGDLDLRVEISSDQWAVKQTIAQRAVESTNSRDWTLQLLDRRLSFMWFPAGTWASRIYRQSTVPLQAYTGQRLALRVTLDVNNGSGGHEVRFYTGRTVDDEEWELLGDPIVGVGTTSLYTGNAYMELGGGFEFDWDPNTSAVFPLDGRAYALQLRAGINGTPRVDMKTSQAQPGASDFVDATGVTWHRGGVAVLTNRHIRMTGEVPAWPPTRDLSGQDNIVSIAPTGITRRMDAGNKPQESALLRYIRTRGPIECWPLTDGVDAKTARSMLSGRDMVPQNGSGDTAPAWAGGTLADWVEPVLTFKSGKYGGLTGYTPRRTSVGSTLHADVFLTGAALDGFTHVRIWDTGAGTNSSPQNAIFLILGGDTNQATLIRHSEMTDSSSESFIGNFFNIGVFDDQPHHLRLTVNLDSPFVELVVDGVVKASSGLDVNMRPLSRIELAWGVSTADRSAGYVTYWGQDGPTAAEMYGALMGFQGEAAGARIQRLATESGYTASVSGQPEFQQPMGIQGQAKLLALLNEANASDFGYLLDARDRAEVIQRGGSTLWNQPPALVLDYAAGVIGAPFRPVDDDKLTENDVSVRRAYGSVAAQHVLEEGELSVQDPPDGVGRYDNAYTYSLATDGQADQVASMRLHLGTYNGVRYTRITLNLANPRVFAMIDEILRIDVGDKIRLTNLPADHGPDAVDVLVHGYEEEAGPDAWTLTFNCRPGEPWTTGLADGAASRADTDGSQLASGINATATTVSLASTGERLWTSDPFDMPFDLRVGGEVITVTAPGTPVTLNPFFETNVADWAGVNAAIARVTDIVHPDPRAVASMRVTPAGGFASLDARSSVSAAGTITPGVAYTSSAWVYSPNGWSDLRSIIDWYDAAGTYLSSGASTAVVAPAGTWTYLATTNTAPAGASRCLTRVRSGNTPTTADVFYVWAARATPASSGSGPQTYTVVRSVNGVTKSHTAGADVRLATPNYVAL
ncbi:hypothetical protein [Streptomyces sp. NPDC048188]|uniref:hypothetical protein n=1 Tax=Streptomyces sp. NPDC048188 TaxID=3155749 RepID=UPI00343D3386